MEITTRHKTFLLGGYDLEMLTIKQMLEGMDDCVVIDKQLRWDNARLSAYQDELRHYTYNNIYGIELQEDITPPDNYHRIDHHNDWDSKKSALEQVAEVLEVTLNRQQQLIAANDKGYIPAMQELSATEEEIASIRKEDRKAQGVTEVEEQLAEETIKNHLQWCGSLAIVKSQASRFSPICDRLFPYKRLLIYTDHEWVFYGEGKTALISLLNNDIRSGKIYHGGGNQGYIGCKKGAYSTLEIHELVEKMKRVYMSTISYHNFSFPFQWWIKGFKNKIFSEQINLNNISYALDSNWERNISPANTEEANSIYNERNYFYEFVHDALYDKGTNNSLIRHFERKEPKHGEVTYIVDCGEKKYDLKVHAINLNLYSTGVGVLSFYLYNDKYPDPEDVMKINQTGRRVFPPFIASVDYRGIIANSIEVKGLKGRKEGYKEDFRSYTNEKSNQPASFIKDMINEVAKNIIIKPVIDDRMFVQCWYKNDEWTRQFVDRYDEFLNNTHWYEFVFVDDYGGMTCHNNEMQYQLIKKATYERWQKQYSLYGISRYSMMYLTNFMTEKEAPYVLQYFETMYARMVELVLVQKASVLRFSEEVTNLSNMDYKRGVSRKVSSLYKEYIRFVNQIHFREISPQDQGIEMYQKLYDTMNLEKHVEKLDAEIGELYNYVSLKEDRKSNNTIFALTSLATIAVPMTVIAGIFGMNNYALSQTDMFYNSGRFQLSIVLLGGLLGMIAVCILLVRNWKNK